MKSWLHHTVSLLLLLTFLFVPILVSANVSVRPMLIDHEVEQRSLVTEQITLTNTTQNQLTVYATVNEVALGEGGEIKGFIAPGAVDRSVAITSWLEITRGRITIPPGETIIVPVTIAVHHNAVPGLYHAFIGFVSASKRHEAEAAALAGNAAGTIIRLELPDQRLEGVRISRFVIDRFVSGLDVHIAEITLQNVGEVPILPTGEIIFYDSRGREVAMIDLRATDVALAPGEQKSLQYTLPDDFSLGRHKANIRLQYGSQQLAQLTDTTFFLVIPWTIIATFFAILFTVIVVLLVWWRKHTYQAVISDEIDDVRVFVSKGTSRNPADHDINLRS